MTAGWCLISNNYDHLPRPCSYRDLPAQKMLQVRKVFCSFGEDHFRPGKSRIDLISGNIVVGSGTNLPSSLNVKALFKELVL
jgi:hypothetical protein